MRWSSSSRVPAQDVFQWLCIAVFLSVDADIEVAEEVQEVFHDLGLFVRRFLVQGNQRGRLGKGPLASI